MTYRLLFVVFLVMNQAHATVGPDELDNLVTRGATELALDILSHSGAEDGASWVALQKQKLAIYQRQEAWDAILDEVGKAVAFELEETDRQWFQTQAAIAYIGKGEGASAREILIPLLWAEEKVRDVAQLPTWRQLVIRSYLVEGRMDDAYTAMLRYDQDYPDAIDSSAWAHLKAEVLILADTSPEGEESAEAVELLSGVAAAADDPVLVLARLKSGQAVSATDIVAVIDRLRHGEVMPEIRQPLHEALLASYDHVGSLRDRVVVLENLLSSTLGGEVDPRANADLLWRAYGDLAKEVANREQLLIGNYEPWVTLAESLEATAPVEARALNGWLALNAGEELAQKAHERFGMELDRAYGSFDLLAALYLASSHYEGGENLPVSVRYRLLDQALTKGDTIVAKAMMNSLPRPKGVKGLVDWQLRRARIQVLAGTAEYGAKLLEQLAKAGYTFDPVQLDAYMQVFYDLQAAAENALGYRVAELILPQVEGTPSHALLLWWMADIKAAEGDFVTAARDYLRIVDTPDSGEDRDALLRAAQALAQADMKSDAARLYEAVLARESNPVRRAMIKRQMQRLQTTKAMAIIPES